MQHWINIIPVNKGWSGDQKFHVTDQNGNQYLLRISPAHSAERKKRQFAQMQLVSALNIPMCHPVDFEVNDEGACMLMTWIDGQDAEDYIPRQSPEKQYAYGLEAGRILKIIHSVPAPADQPDWEVRFNRKIDRKIQIYSECPLKYENDSAFLSFIENNRRLLRNRPQSYQHGDYHIGNMMIDQNGKLTIIDFDRDDYGDPWEEFNRIVWCAQAAPLFASGMVDGYFDSSVPEQFWRLLALYITTNTLSSLPWAIPFGKLEIQTMRHQASEVLNWYDQMSKVVPDWYSQPESK